MRLKAVFDAALSALILLGGSLLLPAEVAGSASRSEPWQAGFASVIITPDQPMWLSGYGGRNRPSEGKVHELYARAAAIRDPAGKRVVFVASDLIGVPIKMVEGVSRAVEKRHGIQRADIMFTCSHTHCGPALDDKLSHMLAMDETDWKQVRQYQKQLNTKLIDLIDQAIEDLRPAALWTGNGVCRFAANRRAPIGIGPYDHSVPVLKVTSLDGSKVRGVIFGYACHNTTLSFYKWCGDYAGFAALYLEDRFPDATALFFSGCGGDQNPLPRRKIELAEKYGRMLGVAVENVFAAEMTAVEGRLRTAFENIEAEFASLPGRAELEEQLRNGSRYERARAELLLEDIEKRDGLAKSHLYPIQLWQLGGHVTWVALGGEVVVDYALRLKEELGPARTWVAGYANHVMAYIPTERVLAEGGYEGRGSMVVYQLPAPWKSGLEERIVATVHELSKKVRSR